MDGLSNHMNILKNLVAPLAPIVVLVVVVVIIKLLHRPDGTKNSKDSLAPKTGNPGSPETEEKTSGTVKQDDQVDSQGTKEVKEVDKEVEIDNSEDNPTDEEVIKDEQSGECGICNYEELLQKIDNGNLRELIRDRITEYNSDYDDVERWALGVIDLVDEIVYMEKSYTEAEKTLMEELTQSLRDNLKSRECEVIDVDEWTPAKQRAIKVNRVLPSGSPYKIVRKGASGLIVRGRLIRKQEVIVDIPEDK